LRKEINRVFGNFQPLLRIWIDGASSPFSIGRDKERFMLWRSACVMGLVSAIGCGAAEMGSPSADVSGSGAGQLAYLQQGVALPEEQSEGAVDARQSDEIAPTDRKIIYHAQLRIDVTDFSEAASAVDAAVSRHGGFVASSRLGGESGSTRNGHWTLRVPVERYRPFVNELAGLGELREQNETSKEVTAEFSDLQARIRNKQLEEERLLTHLNETARQLPEILTIEKELSRVREEVERMQGRLKLLVDQTSLSTVDLAVAEIETFVPAESPGFVTRIHRAWNGSTETLLAFLQGLAILSVALFPWLVVFGLLGALILPIALLIRRRLHAPAQ
jgi:hypothetical protein